MIDKKFWEGELENLDMEELKEVTKLVNKYKKLADTREEFMDVVKRWAEKYPQAKYFFTGNAWKGAYECEGEWGVRDWTSTYNLEDIWDELIDYVEEEDQDHGDVEILDEFDNKEDWKNSILNFYIKENDKDYKQFDKEFNDSKHKPVWKIEDAENLYNGEDMYEFIDIKTKKKAYLYTSQYGN